MKFSVLLIVLCSVCSHAFAKNSLAVSTQKVSADLALYDSKIEQIKAKFSKIPADVQDRTWVKAKLQNMFETDQYMRSYLSIPYAHKYTADEKKDFDLKFMIRFNELDRQNTTDFKDLLKVYHWFTISEFGAIADEQAFLIAQHADLDPKFQKQVLDILESLYQAGETKPANYAYLYDRVASSFHDPAKRKLQRYGSQGACTGLGTWQPLPSEDPANLDKRRKDVGLPPEAEYILLFKDICK